MKFNTTAITAKTGVSKTAAADWEAGDKITFAGGSFSVYGRSARTGRNPQTGAENQLAASKSGKFSAGKDLKGL